MEQNDRKPGPFAKISNLFRGSSNKNLFNNWKQSGEHDDWSIKAVDGLVKKLRKKPDGIRDFEHAIKYQDPSKCVTIPRSMDGRLQVSNYKQLPHVMYCRIFRWPDLQTHHELKAIPVCEFAFNARKSEVCVNPYHYNRVENNSVLPPILVPRHSDFVPGYSLIPKNQSPFNGTNQFNATNQPANQMMNPQSPTAQYSPVSLPSSDYQSSMHSNVASAHLPPANLSPISTASNSSGGYQNYYSAMHITAMDALNSMPSPPPEIHYQQKGTGNYYQTQQQQSQWLNQPQVNHFHSTDVVPVPYEEPEYWADISYYELHHRVGEQYRCHVSCDSVTVDGFTSPESSDSNRFSLGRLSSINRNSTIENIRKAIGKGIHIFFAENELYIKCLSDSPIFVHSNMLNLQFQEDEEAVCKVLPNEQKKIFDYNEFAALIDRAVYSEPKFENTMDLTKLCTIRISFVKGWGGNYPRHDVTATPCWIEIHLRGPLKWLDNVLSKLDPPKWAITSVS